MGSLILHKLVYLKSNKGDSLILTINTYKRFVFDDDFTIFSRIKKLKHKFMVFIFFIFSLNSTTKAIIGGYEARKNR